MMVLGLDDVVDLLVKCVKEKTFGFETLARGLFTGLVDLKVCLWPPKASSVYLLLNFSLY